MDTQIQKLTKTQITFSVQNSLLVLTLPSIGYQWSPFTWTTIRQSGAWGEGRVGAGAGPLNHRYVFMDVFYKYRYTKTNPRWFLIVETVFGGVVISGSQFELIVL